jgi:hypothetical protein
MRNVNYQKSATTEDEQIQQFIHHRGFLDNGPQHNKYIASKKRDSI